MCPYPPQDHDFSAHARHEPFKLFGLWEAHERGRRCEKCKMAATPVPPTLAVQAFPQSHPHCNPCYMFRERSRRVAHVRSYSSCLGGRLVGRPISFTKHTMAMGAYPGGAKMSSKLRKGTAGSSSTQCSKSGATSKTSSCVQAIMASKTSIMATLYATEAVSSALHPLRDDIIGTEPLNGDPTTILGCFKCDDFV